MYYTAWSATRCQASGGAGLEHVRHLQKLQHDQLLFRALAAVAVTGAAFAQSNVTISGNLNINALSNSKMTYENPGEPTANVKGRTTASDNGWTASQILFAGSEDLGGGLTASFAVATGLGNGTSTFADRDRFLQLSGDFGSVRFGRFVPTAAMGFHGFSGAATTNQAGTIYGLGAAAANTDAGAASQAQNFGALTGGSFERNSNNVQYASPDFNGFTFTVNYGTSSTDFSAQGYEGKTEARQSGLGIAYASGPLSIAAGMQDRTVKRERVPEGEVCYSDAGVFSIDVFGDNCGTNNQTNLNTGIVNQRTQKSDLDWIGASYDFGVATLFGTHVKRKAKTTNQLGVTAANDDTKVNAIGVSVPVGAFTLNASTYRGKNKMTEAANDDVKLSGHQLSVRYALSNRTTIYAAMGQNQVKRDGANVAGEATKFTSNAVGLMHSF